MRKVILGTLITMATMSSAWAWGDNDDNGCDPVGLWNIQTLLLAPAPQGYQVPPQLSAVATFNEGGTGMFDSVAALGGSTPGNAVLNNGLGSIGSTYATVWKKVGFNRFTVTLSNVSCNTDIIGAAPYGNGGIPTYPPTPPTAPFDFYPLFEAPAYGCVRNVIVADVKMNASCNSFKSTAVSKNYAIDDAKLLTPLTGPTDTLPFTSVGYRVQNPAF